MFDVKVIRRYEAWKNDDTGYWCVVLVRHSTFNGRTWYTVVAADKMTRKEAEGRANKMNDYQ